MLHKIGLGRRDFTWVSLIILAIGYTGLFIPLRILFQCEIDALDLVLNVVSSMIFAGYIFLHKSDTGWLTAKNNEAFFSNRFQLAIVVTPFEVLAWLIPVESASPLIALVRLLSLMRLSFLFAYFKISYRCSAKLTTFAVFVTSAIAIHWISLLWILIRGTNLSGQAMADVYITSLYWVITTLTTVGYGDITPTGNAEKIFTMLVMILGVGFYGVVIGTVSHAIFAANKYSQHAKEKLGDISAFMQHYKVPLPLQKTVYAYYQNIMAKQLSDDDDKFISELPPTLQHELRIFKKVGLIRNLAAFRGATDSCLRDVARALKSRFYSPGEKVINKGDVGYEMYIVSRGAVKIIYNNEVIAHLKDGQFFGEMALIEHNPRTADVVAQTYSDIYILEKDSFNTIAAKHPQLYETIKRAALERKKNLK